MCFRQLDPSSLLGWGWLGGGQTERQREREREGREGGREERERERGGREGGRRLFATVCVCMMGLTACLPTADIEGGEGGGEGQFMFINVS